MAPRSRVVAIIKANGYGHGFERAARALADADMFGVASIDEALELRAAGVDRPLLLLEGVFEANEVPVAQREGFAVVVHHAVQMEMIESAGLTRDRPIHAWLKLDTGMHRLGFAPSQLAAALARLRACDGVAGDIVVMSHLAKADERNSDVTNRQAESFERATSTLGLARSLANSAGIITWPRTHYDWVRPGIMLYGISPFDDSVGAQEGLQPAMTVKSRLIAVNRHARGDAIGYGGTWTCPEDMPVGVVAFGYGDGYPRHAPNGTPVLVNGRRVPLIGRVSMDMITVDLRAQPDAQVGDPVTLWGDGLPVEEIARAAQTIAYQVVCSITRRVKVVAI
jgi:alanine racemase